MTIFGLDLSLTSTGWARIDEQRAITVGRIWSKGNADDGIPERCQRLSNIVQTIYDLIDDEPIEMVVVEGPSHGHLTGHHHDRSGLWWLVVEAIASGGHGFPIEVAPSSLKKYATGKGNAGKDVVLLAVSRRYPDVPITGNDEADALVLAAMGARWLGCPIEASLPAVNLEAMTKVAWPDETGAT